MKRCSKCKESKGIQCFWREKHTKDGLKPSCIECYKKQREPNKERLRAATRNWMKENKERVNAYRRKYDKERYATDIAYRLKIITKNAIIASIRKNKFTSYSADKLTEAIFKHLPYTAEQLKTHIESLWEPWMNWDNFGRYNANTKTWQIDHIIPQSRFTFSDFEDDSFKKLWALKNLRPLETVKNILKSDN